MRHITNKQNLIQLAQANETPPQTAREATSQWQRFNHKPLLGLHLLTEQYGLCAYSEICPDVKDIGIHIEHVKPKSQYPEQTFDYQNLIASALHSDDLQTLIHSQVFGGHAKLSEYDPALFISCLDNDCAHFFAYLSDGRVVPSVALNAQEQQQANYTITLLNLNSAYLITHRKNWLEEIDELIEEHIDQDMSLSMLAAIHLVPSNNMLYPFFSLTRARFGQIAEDVLAQNAPELL